jgi:hypothetical protein
MIFLRVLGIFVALASYGLASAGEIADSSSTDLVPV